MTSKCTKQSTCISHARQLLWEGAQPFNLCILTSPVNTTDGWFTWEILPLAFYGAYKSKSSISAKFCHQLLEGKSFSPVPAAARLTAGQGCPSHQACFTMPGCTGLCCDTDHSTTVIFYEAFFMSQQRQVPLAWKGEGRAAAVVWSRVRAAQCCLLGSSCQHVGKNGRDEQTQCSSQHSAHLVHGL